MWKKILYYCAMAVLTVVFMLASYYSAVTNRFVSIVEKSIKKDDYTNIVKLFSGFANNTPAYEAKLADGATIRIYETATVRESKEDDKKTDFFDYNYSIYLVNSSIKLNEVQDSEGNQFNKHGFELKSGDKSVEYTLDNASKYTNYTNLTTNAVDLKIYQIELPYEFVNKNLGENIDKIIIRNADGTEYTSLADLNFNFDSNFFEKIKEIKPVFNDKETDNNSRKEIFNKWKAEYDTDSNFIIGMSNKDLFPASFWLKLVGIFIAIVFIILVIGDTLVGKKRVIRLINSLTNKNKHDDSNIIDYKDVKK